MTSSNNEQSWKRASGDGFQIALAELYNPRFAVHEIRLIPLNKTLATTALKELGLFPKIAASKIDIAIEGNCDLQHNKWKIFGVIHMKVSLAERISDDAPASRAVIERGFVSIAVTLDSKSFPPPHGNGINYGELGGRTIGNGLKDNQQKRNYIEVDGDFTHLYSYNLRTPPSASATASGSQIKRLSFSEKQPDEFVRDIQAFWHVLKPKVCKEMPDTKVV